MPAAASTPDIIYHLKCGAVLRSPPRITSFTFFSCIRMSSIPSKASSARVPDDGKEQRGTQRKAVSATGITLLLMSFQTLGPHSCLFHSLAYSSSIIICRDHLLRHRNFAIVCAEWCVERDRASTVQRRYHRWSQCHHLVTYPHTFSEIRKQPPLFP